MQLNRPARFVAALVTLWCLLFSQLALAAYVCPAAVDVAVQAAGNDTPMPGCTGMAKSNLCQSHCSGAHPSLDAPAAPLVQPFIAAELRCVLPAAGFVLQGTSAPGTELLVQRSTAPPIAIRNCCFRI